jgi:Polyketide cyclase / dehydrase and lipid transport
MTRWAGARRVEIERSGVNVPNGIGTIRVLKSWHGTIREEVTGFEPERRLKYKGLSGVPAHDYRGVIELDRRGNATQVTWTVSFQPRKFTAAIVSFVIKRMVSTGIDRFVQVAEGKANNRQPG